MHGAVGIGENGRFAGVALGLRSVQPFLSEAGHTGAHQGVDDSRGGLHFPHPEPILLPHVEVVVDIQADGVGHQRGGFHGRSPVPVGGPLAVAQHGGDHPGLAADFPDAVVGVVANMEVALRIERQVLGVVEGCLAGRPSIPVKTHQAETRTEKGPAAAPLGGVVTRAAARPDLDGPALRIDATNRAGPFVGDVDATPLVDRQAAGTIELRLQRRPPVTAPPPPPGAGDPRDDSGPRVDPTDGHVSQVGEIKIPFPVQAQVVRVAHPRFQRRPPVALAAGHPVPREPVQNSLAIDPPEPMGPIVHHDQLPVPAAHHPHGPAGVGVAGRNALVIADPRYRDDPSRRQLSKNVERSHKRLPASPVPAVRIIQRRNNRPLSF